MNVRVEVRPSVLTWARARSGIAEDDWGRRFPKFDAWLAGEAAPTLKQLEDFDLRPHVVRDAIANNEHLALRHLIVPL